MNVQLKINLTYFKLASLGLFLEERHNLEYMYYKLSRIKTFCRSPKNFTEYNRNMREENFTSFRHRKWDKRMLYTYKSLYLLSLFIIGISTY